MFATGQVQLRLDYAGMYATVIFVREGIGSSGNAAVAPARDQATELLRQFAKAIDSDFSSGRVTWRGI